LDARARRRLRAGFEQPAATVARRRSGLEETATAATPRTGRLEEATTASAATTSEHVGRRGRLARVRRGHEGRWRRFRRRGGRAREETTALPLAMAAASPTVREQIGRIAACRRIIAEGRLRRRRHQIAEVADRRQLLPVTEALAPRVGLAVDLAAREALAHFLGGHRS